MFGSLPKLNRIHASALLKASLTVSIASSLAGLRRRISDFCRERVSTALPPLEAERFKIYALNLIERRERPPRRGQGLDWARIASSAELDPIALQEVRDVLRPAFDAIDRTLSKLPAPTRVSPVRLRQAAPKRSTRAMRRSIEIDEAKLLGDVQGGPRNAPRPSMRTRLPPSGGVGEAPTTFSEALDCHMNSRGDTAPKLLEAILGPGETFDRRTINSWRQGRCSPRSVEALRLLPRIERRYGLPDGYLERLLPDPSRSCSGHRAVGIRAAERRRLAWHLPEDFNYRSRAEQEEILEWVRTKVIAGTTSFRRYMATASKTPFGLRFPGLWSPDQFHSASPHSGRNLELVAPATLQEELAGLLAFKTATLTRLGYRRSGVWGSATAHQKVEHLSLFFGALSACQVGPTRGAGVPVEALTLGLFVLPRIWDWYLHWRSERRGFFTHWEVDMLSVAVALTHKNTGWISQSPWLAERLQPIPGLVDQEDVDRIKADWPAACEHLHTFALARAKEVQRVCKVHRDPFEPIMPILEAESPLGEYRKIAHEVLRLAPDERRFPQAAAESARSYLLIRLGLHLGLRQKNLRQLLLCPRDRRPRSERELEDLKRGEIRWSERDGCWEVFIPAVAFKNAHSSFFGQKPFRLLLPNLEHLNERIDAWVDRHRARLIGGAQDPQTFFVKTAKRTSTDASYDQNSFYEAWRLTIQRYGIYNPYTQRGAIVGLLPHGPHNVRDVLATHILKRTGSYEQASYAIQDTPATVAAHYGRFLPQDKAALAAQILNQVWSAA